jgi:hypothetical protein
MYEECEMELKGTVCENVEWIHVAQDRNYCNDAPGSIKGEAFHVQGIDCYLLKNDCFMELVIEVLN